MKNGKMILLTMVTGVVMVMFACGPKYPNCEKDEHCKEHNQYCVDKLCRDCATSEHCKSKGPCAFCGATYTCEKPAGLPGDCCVSDLDCKQGKCWKDPGYEKGRCAQCVSDSDCGANFKCVQGSCVPVGECDDSRPCPPGKKCVNNMCVSVECTLESPYFDFDESAIRADAREVLLRNYECLKQTGRSVTLEGHCDERGSDEYNLALGSRRAYSVKKFLENLGYSGSLMNPTSRGEEGASHCTDDTCWQKDRRVDFR